MKRTLYVKRVSTDDIFKEWAFRMPNTSKFYYVRCNVKGIVNWDTTKVYNPCELVGRDKVAVKK